MISLLLLLTNILILVASDGYICAGKTVIDPPLNLNQPVYYPRNWTEAHQPALFNASQNCNWQINIPGGMYATVVFYRDTTAEEFYISYIYATYSNNDDYNLPNFDEAPFTFTSPGFQVALQADETRGRFSFKVVWSYYPANLCQNLIPLDESQLIPSLATNCLTTFIAPNRVWLVPFYEEYTSSIRTKFRNIVIFEGKSMNGTFLGTLYYALNYNLLSEGKSLTVYAFGMQIQNDRNVFLGMDLKAAGDITFFRGLDCADDATCGIYPRHFSNSASTAVITASRNVDYLYNEGKLSENATLQIYEGQINDEHLLTTLEDGKYYEKLPIAVKNTVKIYKVTNGYATVALTNNAAKVDYENIQFLDNSERRKLIHSFDYRQLSYQQDTFERFTSGGQLLKLNFSVVYFDTNGPTTLEIIVFQKGMTVFSEMFTSSNRPLSTGYVIWGDTISVYYQTHRQQTNGFEVDLVCTKIEDVVTTQTTTQMKTTTRKATTTTTKSSTTVPATVAVTPTKPIFPTTGFVSTTIPTTTTTISSTSISTVQTTIETTTRGSRRHSELLGFVFVVIFLLK